MIEYKSCDIFSLKVDAIVNPVNCVGVMGAGLAKQFARRHNHTMKQYKLDCKEGKIKLGECYVYGLHHIESLALEDLGIPLKYIFAFPTKNHWRDKSDILAISKGLHKLSTAVMINPNIQSIAIPALGCGLGQLKWDDVKRLIDMCFSVSDKHIIVTRDWTDKNV